MAMSNADGTTPVVVYADPATNRLLVNATITGSISAVGTEYGNGSVTAAPMGTLAMGYDGTAVRALSSDSSGRLQVNVIAGTVTATLGSGSNTLGTVTVQNTSGAGLYLQALPAGGNTIGSVFADLRFINGVAVSVGNGVSGTGVQRVTIASDSTGQVALAAGSNVVGTVYANVHQLKGVAISVGNGTTDTGTQRVTISSDSTGTLVLAAGSATVGTVTAVGNVAHDAVDSGNPQKIGFKAYSALSANTSVASSDRSDAVSDLDGAQIMRLDATLGDNVNGTAAITTNAVTQVIAAQGANIKVYITDVTIANTSGSAVTVDLRDGTTTRWTFPVPSGTAGVVYSFRRPLGGTANTAWNAAPSGTAATLYVSLLGFKSRV